MKKVIISISTVVIFFSILACSSKSEQEYFDQANKFLKEKKYKEALESFKTLIHEYPESNLASKSLVSIAELYHSNLIAGSNPVESYKKAAETYFQVYEKYPDSEEAPVALFQSGFLYDNELKNYDEATKKYNLFLEKYPNHKYTPIVKQSLDIMGLNPEDIINKKQSAKN
jgi:TolA-binding protein